MGIRGRVLVQAIRGSVIGGAVRRSEMLDNCTREDLNPRPPGPEAATKCTDVRRNVVLTRCSGQSESYLGGAFLRRAVQRTPYPPSGEVHAGCDWWKKSSSCRSVSSARDASVLLDPRGE